VARRKRKLIRILIADDHAMVREGLTAVLGLARDMRVVGEVDRADRLRAALAAIPCDILLLDLKLDRWVIDDIAELAKTTKVIALTGSDRDEDLIAAFRLGARAIIQKTAAAETVREAIRAVAAGMVWLPPAFRTKLTAQSQTAATEELTARESEIVRQVAIGLRNAEVGRKLSITEGTVKIHLSNISRKLNIRDRVELTVYAFRSGLIATATQRR